ncbi:MAG: universal stress protein [Acidimicrobiia bacterium]
MGETVLACLDGSERCLEAVAEGIAVLAPDTTFVVATVIGTPDPSLVTGTGMAGGTMSAEEFDRTEAERLEVAEKLVADGRAALGLDAARTEVLIGDPGRAICDFAAKEEVAAVVMGSRGHGGFKRAVLGSVSDHVVRHAPCPVVVTGQHHE